MENEKQMVSVLGSTANFNETWMLTADQLKLLVTLYENDLLADWLKGLTELSLKNQISK